MCGYFSGPRSAAVAGRIEAGPRTSRAGHGAQFLHRIGRGHPYPYEPTTAYCRAAGAVWLGNRLQQVRKPDVRRRPADGPIFYTAIGASDGIGFGSSSPCLPFTDCPDGEGYVQILRRQLQATGRTVDHRNLSLPGAVLSRAIEDLARDIGQPISDLAGNFIDRQAPFVPTNTTHVTIFAGGNDANVIGRAVARGPRRQRRQRLHRRAGPAMGHRPRGSGRAHPQPRPERAHRRAQHDQPGRRAVSRVAAARRKKASCSASRWAFPIASTR